MFTSCFSRLYVNFSIPPPPRARALNISLFIPAYSRMQRRRGRSGGTSPHRREFHPYCAMSSRAASGSPTASSLTDARPGWSAGSSVRGKKICSLRENLEARAYIGRLWGCYATPSMLCLFFYGSGCNASVVHGWVGFFSSFGRHATVLCFRVIFASKCILPPKQC